MFAQFAKHNCTNSLLYLYLRRSIMRVAFKRTYNRQWPQSNRSLLALLFFNHIWKYAIECAIKCTSLKECTCVLNMWMPTSAEQRNDSFNFTAFRMVCLKSRSNIRKVGSSARIAYNHITTLQQRPLNSENSLMHSEVVSGNVLLSRSVVFPLSS